MHLSKKGQSLIDAAVILALVLAGVLIMRPYVTRSLNALFKGYEEDVQQADQEKFKMAPPKKVRVGPCRCGPWTPAHLAPCGDGTSCPIGTRKFKRSCFSCPPSMPKKQCRLDNTCCTDWTLFCSGGNYDCCGANVSNFQPYGNWPGPGGPKDSCADGYGKAWQKCGGKTSFRCEKSIYCDFSCAGGTGEVEFSQMCTHDDHRLLNKFEPWRLVDTCSPMIPNPPGPDIGSAPKCEQICDEGYVKKGNICEECNKPYTTRAVKSITAHIRNGCQNSASCGNRNFSRSGCGPCNFRMHMKVTAWCEKGFEAVNGNCFLYDHGGGYTPGGFRYPRSHPGATGGWKVKDTVNDIEGWNCQFTEPPNACLFCNWRTRYSLGYTRAHCVPKETRCPKPPTLFCEALPSEYDFPYRKCRGNSSKQWDSKYPNNFLNFCTGNCGWVQAKQTWCCNQPSSSYGGCVVLSSHSPDGRTPIPDPPPCPKGKVEWISYCEGEADSGSRYCRPKLDSKVRICCGSRPTGECRVLRTRHSHWIEDPRLRPRRCTSTLGKGWYELTHICTGNCDGDDTKMSICCKP